MDKLEQIQEEKTLENEIITNTQPSQPPQPVETKKKKVVFALPGDNFSSRALISWSNTIATLLKTDKYDITMAPGTGSFVPFVRMQTLGVDVRRGITQKPFNGEYYDVWISIDSDIVYTPDNIIQLIEDTDKYPVVCGMYRMADLQNFAVIKDWDVNYFAKNGTFEFLTEESIKKWKEETSQKYMPVNYTGLGFFACRKEVLDKLKYPYFNGDMQEIISEDGVVMRDISSEDVNFCKNIVKAGFEIVLNTELRVGHYKSLVI
jgi:hypothetical protein